ncbi:MAG: hypothetical protein WCO35_01565 [Candidatus Nomurabacteria bacterium]
MNIGELIYNEDKLKQFILEWEIEFVAAMNIVYTNIKYIQNKGQYIAQINFRNMYIEKLSTILGIVERENKNINVSALKQKAKILIDISDPVRYN